jgi:acetyltransferase-like isoleucine patch superfamily enzyme
MNEKKYKIQQVTDRFICMFYGSKWFHFPFLIPFKTFFYRKHFKMGVKPAIEYNVHIKRIHGLRGTIKIGNRVLLARGCEIDYSGGVVLEDDVWISENAQIHSHYHKLNQFRVNRPKEDIIPQKIILKKGCWIGANAIVLPQAIEIGENSVVGAGSVVTKPVPANVVVAGNPAKIIRNI